MFIEWMEYKLKNCLILVYLISLKHHNLFDADKIKKIQNRKIRQMMRCAYEIPLYRKKFEQVHMTPEDFKCAEDLKKFPLLTKQEIREWIEPEVRNNPKKFKYWKKYTTSGSTGTPLMVVGSPKEDAILSANWLRIACVNGINPIFDKTMALKDPQIIKQRNGKDSIFQKFGVCRRTCVSFLADGKTILDAINSEKPDFLYINRSKLVQTLMYVQEKGLEIYEPKLVSVVGEGIDKNSEDLINKYFSNVINASYGLMETGACSFTLKGDYKRYYFTGDTHVVNIYNSSDNENGRIVVTNLFFKKYPIINYDTLDSASTGQEAGVPYMENICGKFNDMLHFADGSDVDYHSFYSVMEKRNDILQFRIVQKSFYQIEIHLVKNNEKALLSNEKISHEIESAIRGIIRDQKVNYDFIWHDELEPDDNGKRRFIISEVK
ncbi:MAG: hypothetical protein LIO62_05975 [Clostridiales bacterium]|nr:hypothetical protein [Clostridiales bacterium]